MVECRHCGQAFAEDPVKVGARCPRCREPLYERPDRRPSDEKPPPGGAMCAIHAQVPAVMACQGCGTAVCAVCRTRWGSRALCVTCVEKALQEHEKRPEDPRAHRRQALLALLLGIGAWVLVLGSALPILLIRAESQTEALVNLSGLLLLTSLLPAMVGIGQGAAAVRARGNRLMMGTVGLVLSGAHVGCLLGLLLFSIIQQ